MSDSSAPRGIHPLVAAAAIAVILASLVGVAAIMGWLPKGKSDPNAALDPALVASAALPAASPVEPAPMPAAVPPPAPAPVAAQPAPVSKPVKHREPRPAPATTTQTSPAPSICSSCGTVEAVDSYTRKGEGTGIGAVGGAVAGGLIGNQIGGGTGKTIATVVGALGGGYAGNQVEKTVRSVTEYQVKVRMEDGSLQTFTYTQAPAWRTGDRVKISNGSLVAY